jgi:hypothetical protein
MKLVPKKWDEFQHYKDRSPPWIKLHRDLLNNREYLRLPLASKALAPFLWLLASESNDAVFEASIDELEFRLRFSRKEIEDGLKPLIDNGFFSIASGVLAPCLQVAIPEREGETEKRERRPSPKNALTTIPDNFGISEKVVEWAKEKQFDRLEEHFENFVNQCIAKNYKYANWDIAFMNAIRGDWAKVRVAPKKSFVEQKIDKDREDYERMVGR